MMIAAGETTTDVNVGRVEGAQAATTSVIDSTSQNQTGVVEGQTGVVEGQTGVVAGQTAKTTSEDDTFVHYGGHVFQVPAGAIEQYNSEKEFLGYQIGGQTVTIAQMMTAAGETTTDVNVGRVEGAQAATTSTSINNIGVVAGQTAKTTSEADSYVHYGGHVFQVPDRTRVDYLTLY
jgi:hypothetical protein